MALLELDDVTTYYGQMRILERISIEVEAGDLIRGPALEEASSAAMINKQRIAIYADFDEADPLEPAIVGGKLRHELRHAEQRLSPCGPELFDLVELADHRVFITPASDKVAIAAEMASRPARSLFFVRTKHGAARLALQLSRAGAPAAADADP